MATQRSIVVIPKKITGFKQASGECMALLNEGRLDFVPKGHNAMITLSTITGGEVSGAVHAVNGVLMPGLADMHTHPVNYSLVMDELNPVYIFGITNKEDIVKKMSEEAGERKEKGIIIAYGLNTMKVRDLTKKDLDKVAKDIPVVVFDASYHGAVLNSKALEMVKAKAVQRIRETGIDLIGHCGENGQVTEDFVFLNFSTVDDAIGRGKGIRETAEIEAGLITNWLKKAILTGTTHFNDMIVFTPTQLLATLIAAERWEKEKGIPYPVGKIYLRPELFATLMKNRSNYTEVWNKLNPWLDKQKVGLKLLADGSFGSYTARLAGVYEGIPGLIKGVNFDTWERVKPVVEMIATIGIKDVRMHAIGDEGISNATRIVDQAKDVLGNDTRIGIEHFELSGDPLILQFTKAINPTVCMQPNFNTDIFDYEDRLGRRVKLINPLRSILDNGIPMTFGTDGMPQSMLFAVMAATHHPVKGQRLTVDEALHIASLDYSSQRTGQTNPNENNLIVVNEDAANRLEIGSKTAEKVAQEVKGAWTVHSELDKAVTDVILSGKIAVRDGVFVL